MPGVYVEKIVSTTSPTPDTSTRTLDVRNYVNKLEASIDLGTQWAVFEPNDEILWAKLRATIENLLTTEWRNGKLVGNAAKDAFFVRCDRSSMTQDDLVNGRLVCVIGVAVTKPAEFVVFNISKNVAVS
jgi:hypothetical protein